MYLVGLQCLVSICEGFASTSLPLCNSILAQRAKGATTKIQTTISITLLAEDTSIPPLSVQTLNSVHGMIDNGWPALLAALSFIIATNLSDSLFCDVLQSYIYIANVSGIIGLTTPRDAFLTSLAKFAIPSRVVSSVEAYSFVDSPSTPRAVSSPSALGFGSNTEGTSAATSQTSAPGLSDRNMACLKALVASATFLAGSLGSTWFDILETLQNADYVLTARGQRSSAARLVSAGAKSTESSAGSQGTSHPSLLSDVDVDSVQKTIQRLFDNSKSMDDNAFHEFVTALCRLSSDMIGMQLASLESTTNSPLDNNDLSSERRTSIGSTGLVAQDATAHRRRVSGIHLSRTLVSTFVLEL